VSTLITGATGFLGEFVARELAGAGVPLAAFARPTSGTEALARLGLELRAGDLADYASLAAAMRGVDTLVNVASLGFGHAENILRAACEAGVRRAVFVSTTSIYTRLPAPTVPVRRQAEALVRASGLAYTLVRPTMIYGTPRDRNIWRLLAYLRRAPAIPVFGDGRALQQPVYVEDVARAIACILAAPATVGREYDLPGAAALTFNELIDTAARALGRRVKRIHLPLWLGLTLAGLGRRLPGLPRLSPEQILRLAEDKAYSYDMARSDFGYNPLDFPAGVRLELRHLQ
jgi:uncharacterized protein YbjT (DUF2867 family)